MKKILALVMFMAIILSCCACGSSDNSGEEKDYYTSVCTQLEKTSMGGTEYTRTQIDELESRFTKMNLTAGFSKVTHFRSTSEYAYVIEFENAEDAEIFFNKIGTANYNVKKFDCVVIYGKTNTIDSLE